MKTRLIWSLVIITLVCTIGLAYVQIQWVYSAILSERENFDYMVHNVLYAVTDMLELEEEDNILNIIATGDMKLSTPDTIDAKLTSKYKSQQPRANRKEYITSLIKQISDTLYNIKSLDKESRDWQKAFANTLLSIAENINKPIEQRVSKEHIAQLLQQEFLHNHIDLPYEFAVVNANNEIVIQSDGYQTSMNPKNAHSMKLFPSDPSYISESFLVVNIPHKSSYVIRSIATLLYITIALLVVMVVLFSITLITIFRQKHLSAIKNDFISNITHELKTPIATISLAGQMLGDQDINNQTQRIHSLATIVRNETKRLSLLVEKILQISAFEQGKIKLRKKEIDMHPLIHTAIANFSLQLHSLGAEVFTDLRAENTCVFGDEARLMDVLSNLIDNAIKYRKEEECLQIHVHTKNIGTNFELTITDNGVGIASEHLKRIFDKFYRIPNKNVHNIKGFGLGLNYAKEIITMHNGTLWVHSELQKGCTFGVTLPTTDTKNQSNNL